MYCTMYNTYSYLEARGETKTFSLKFHKIFTGNTLQYWKIQKIVILSHCRETENKFRENSFYRTQSIAYCIIVFSRIFVHLVKSVLIPRTTFVIFVPNFNFEEILFLYVIIILFIYCTVVSFPLLSLNFCDLLDFGFF